MAMPHLTPRRFRGLLVLVGLALVAGLADRSTADDGPECLVDHSQGDDPSEGSVARTGVLVLRNGRIATGRILRSGGDFVVEHRHGNIWFAGTEVRLHCASLNDAYGQLHEAAEKEASPKAHLVLARWCVTNKLLDEAHLELDCALALNPESEEARDMLRRLEELREAHRVPEPAPKAAVHVSAGTSPRHADDEIESLAGVSREQARQFTRRIQPLLVNNCAIAGCHGPQSETGFRLQRVVPGRNTSRMESERNLAEILEQVDFQSPRSSPLLTIPRGKHGRNGKTGFPGPRGADQYNDLRQWVLAIAKSDLARARQDGSKPRPAGKIEQVAARVESPSRESPSRESTPKKSRGARKMTMKSPDAKEALRIMVDPVGAAAEAAGESRSFPISDPFDVTEFNRQATSPKSRR